MLTPSNSGVLRHLFAIQRKTQISDGVGGFIDTWATYHKDFAAIRQTSSKEVELQEKIADIASHRVTMRYKEGVSGKDRGLFRGRVFNITRPVDLNEEQTEMIIYCREVT